MVTLMKTKVFLYLWLPLVLVCACVKFQESLPDAAADETRISVSVRLSDDASPRGLPGDGSSGGLSDGTRTRSSWHGSPDRVESFVLMAYRGGCLDACVRAHAGDPVSIRLFRGQAYRLYALANVGDFVPPQKESEMKALSLPVGDFLQTDALPMACRVDAFVPHLPGQALTLAFGRLYARLVVHIEKGEWGMLRVGSVRLRQAAAYVHPFAADDAGFTARSGTAVSAFVDGDAASDADLQRLNAGDSLVLYVPQNRQGNLLPGNDDPYRRVPGSLGEKADRCTYLELTARPDGETLLAGDALCRVYLGCNAADNFDIPGNAVLHLSLFLTERLMGGWGWRIDSRLSWQSGAVTGWLAEGMHALDDLYVGEVFRYAVQPSDAFLRSVGGDFSRCSLRLGGEEASPLPAEADTTLIFSGWTPSGDGIWYADGHCRRPVDAGSIRLCLDGNELFTLSEALTIRLPDYSFPPPPDVLINAGTLTRCPLDLCDRQGRSLTFAYGFDADLFDPHFSLVADSDAAQSSAEIPPLSAFSQWTAEAPSASAPFGACGLAIFHTGERPEVARFLTESLQKEGALCLQVQDGRYPIEAFCPLRTDILPIRFCLTDGGSPESSWRLCVSNPSLLPMDVGMVFLPSGWVENAYAQPPAVCQTLSVLGGPSDLFLAKRVKVFSEQVRDTLSLAVSVATLRTHCQACACHFDAIRWVGVEPGLRYGDCCDKRLDGRVEMRCALSVSEPDCGLFASSAEIWNRNQAYAEPLWLRYSAYDDIGTLHITSGFQKSDWMPTVSFRTDREGDAHLFKLSYNGYINGFVRIERASLPDVSYDISKSFRSDSQWVPADGQVYSCSDGNFAARCQEILQMGSDVFEPKTHYYPLIQNTSYALALAYEPVDRIFSPEYAGSLHFEYYDRKVGHNWYVGYTVTAPADRRLYLFE